MAHRDSMAHALAHLTRGAPVVDLIAPPPTAERDPDALDALLAPAPAPGALLPHEQDKVRLLGRLQEDKRNYEAKAKALGGDIRALTDELYLLAAERQLYNTSGAAKGKVALPDVPDPRGGALGTSDYRRIWPAYRKDPVTDQKYQAEDVVAALRALGRDDLIAESPAAHDWPGYVSARVKRWRERCGEDGVTDEAGHYVDHDGEPLDPEERDDPCADILALPAALRAIVEPVEEKRLTVTVRAGSRRAVAAMDAVVDAAAVAANGAAAAPDGTADRAGEPD